MDGELETARDTQPLGLFVVAGTEFWDRVSFHGMQSVLTLYLAEELLRPGRVSGVWGFAVFRAALEGLFGHLSAVALASQIFGLYVGLIYLTPVIGGWIGDRFLGRKFSVTMGALMMTCGHFAMAFDASFLVALLLIILGAGALRGNLSAQIDSLYDKTDRRRATAFQIYAAAVNAGGFIAPLITGYLAKTYSWHIGFGFAGVGMLIGLALYAMGGRALPKDVRSEIARTRPSLSRAERTRLTTLILILPISACFWVAQSQIWNVYNLWARDHVDLKVGALSIPPSWLQSLDGLAPLVLMPPVVLFWRWQAKRGHEPNDLVKAAIGCLIFSAGVTWISLGDVVFAPNRVPLAWAVAFHLISNLGCLYFTPTIMSIYARSAPSALRGFMLGVNHLATFFGSLISGRLGGLYESLAPETFWLIHAAIPLGGAAAALIFAGPIWRGLEEGIGQRDSAQSPKDRSPRRPLRA